MQAIACLFTATSHYLSRYWPSCMPPNGVTMSHWVSEAMASCWEIWLKLSFGIRLKLSFAHVVNMVHPYEWQIIWTPGASTFPVSIWLPKTARDRRWKQQRNLNGDFYHIIIRGAAIQTSAVITRSNLSRHYKRRCDNSGRKSVRY